MTGSHFTSESSIDRTMWFMLAGLAILLFAMFSLAGFSKFEQDAERSASRTERLSSQQQAADFELE